MNSYGKGITLKSFVLFPLIYVFLLERRDAASVDILIETITCHNLLCYVELMLINVSEVCLFKHEVLEF